MNPKTVEAFDRYTDALEALRNADSKVAAAVYLYLRGELKREDLQLYSDRAHEAEVEAQGLPPPRRIEGVTKKGGYTVKKKTKVALAPIASAAASGSFVALVELVAAQLKARGATGLAITVNDDGSVSWASEGMLK